MHCAGLKWNRPWTAHNRNGLHSNIRSSSQWYLNYWYLAAAAAASPMVHCIKLHFSWVSLFRPLPSWVKNCSLHSLQCAVSADFISLFAGQWVIIILFAWVRSLVGFGLARTTLNVCQATTICRGRCNSSRSGAGKVGGLNILAVSKSISPQL